MARLGLWPAPFWAALEAGAEQAGGLLLLGGLLTPFVAATLIRDMLVATLEVHASEGLWAQQGGFEYNLALMAVLLAVGMIGPGLYSLDRRLPLTLPRPATFAAALLAALAVAGATVLLF